MSLDGARRRNRRKHGEFIDLSVQLIRVLASEQPTLHGDHVRAEWDRLAPNLSSYREVMDGTNKGRAIGQAWEEAEKAGYVEKMLAILPDDAPADALVMVEVKSRRPGSNQARLTVYRSLIYRP